MRIEIDGMDRMATAIGLRLPDLLRDMLAEARALPVSLPLATRALIRVSFEVLLLRLLYATVVATLYPALDAWWGTSGGAARWYRQNDEAVPSTTAAAGRLFDNRSIHGCPPEDTRCTLFADAVRLQ